MILVEGADRVLPPYPPDLSEKARRQLERLGVEVRTGALVTGVDGAGVQLGDERIAARTVLWAAGVAASPLGGCWAPCDRAGRREGGAGPHRARAIPRSSWSATSPRSSHDGKPVPGVAPAAMQMGRHAAAQHHPRAGGPAAAPRSATATRGRWRPSAARPRWRRSAACGCRASPAWLAWLGIHIFFLIGFRNRVVVMFEWALAYLTYARSARIVLEPAGAVRRDRSARC